MTAPYYVTKSPKSIGVAILLTFLFGPVGLFYASISGGLIMTFTPIILALLIIVGFVHENIVLVDWSATLLVVFILTYWLICIIWATISVNSYNREIEEEAKRQYEIWKLHSEATPNQFSVNINRNYDESNHRQRNNLQETGKPNLKDWLKNNPGKTVNDYYAIFNS